jgi:low temperature requirement protein LtrA
MSMFAGFRRRFWRPPRAHGEIIEDRSVSFLELFYDLVFVVVIARASHTLAHHVSWRGLGEYVVISTFPSRVAIAAAGAAMVVCWNTPATTGHSVSAGQRRDGLPF